MRRISLSIVSTLVILVLFASLAYSADTLIITAVSSEPAAVVAVEPVPQQVNIEASFVNVISDLMDRDVGYQFDDFAAITLVYSPFVTEQNDAHTDQPASDIYVGLKLAF